MTLPLLLAAVVTAGLAAQSPVAPQRPTRQPAAPPVADLSQRLAELQAPAAAPMQQRPAVPSRLPPKVLFDRPRGAELWALGHDWKAAFDGSGFTYIPYFGSEAPQNFPLRFELAEVQVGGERLPLCIGTPAQHDGTVTTDRGGLVETVATTTDTIEQSFTFRTLPNRGAIHVDLAVQTSLQAERIAGGLCFANEHGVVHYTKAVAIDAAGARRLLPIEWDGDSVHLTIPADFVAEAQLPLVLDPLLDTNPGIRPGETLAQRNPDSATLQSPNRSLIVYQRTWSSTDQDCFAEALDANLDRVNPFTLVLDATAENWIGPEVASSQFAGNYLVVAQSTLGGIAFIVSRLVNGNGTVTSQVVDVERAGPVGLPGNNFAPDVGGDPFVGTLAYYCVVWQHATSASNHDIHYKLVQQDGSLLTTMPSVLSGDASYESRPSISETNRTSEWRVAFERQRTVAPFDGNIFGGGIGWEGTLTRSPYPIDTSTAFDAFPEASSPIVQPNGGQEVHLVVWDRTNGTQGDILGNFVRIDGLTLGQFNLDAIEAGGAFAARTRTVPGTDADGLRFVVGYSEFNGTDYDTYATTVRYDAVLGALLDDVRQPLGVTPSVEDYKTGIAAYHSAGLQPSSRYIIASHNTFSNDITVFDYGGYQPGAFFTLFATQCGPLTVTPSGEPIVGGTVQIVANTTAPSGFVLGFPGLAWLGPLGCNCNLGVDQGVLSTGPLTFTIPANTGFVGTFLSAQAYALVSANCFGFLGLSDTVDFIVR